MPKAVWNGVMLAESDATVIVEGNHYFPPDSVQWEFFTESPSHTVCGRKGIASYYSVNVNGQVNRDAAWQYPQPKDAAKQMQGYVAFWHGVEVKA